MYVFARLVAHKLNGLEFQPNREFRAAAMVGFTDTTLICMSFTWYSCDIHMTS